MSTSAHAQFSAFTTDTCAGLDEALSTDPCLLPRMHSFLLSLATHAQVWLEPCAWSRLTCAMSTSAHAQFYEFATDPWAGLAEAFSTDPCLLSRMHSFLLSLATHAQVWLEPCVRSRRTCALSFVAHAQLFVLFKGTVSWDRFQKFWQKFTAPGLSKERSWFLNFLGAPMIL